MPKTTSLRSELLDIQRASDKTFAISVAVWTAPGSRDSSGAIRFQFVTHKNPALWWRLSLTTTRPMDGSRGRATYTNAQYNKALRTATDSLNELITRENDAGRPIVPNLSRSDGLGRSGSPPELPYGQMPNEVAFLMSVSDRFESPFRFNVRFDREDVVRVRYAAGLCDAQIVQSDPSTLSITSSRDLYKIIQALWQMRRARGDEDAGKIAAAMMGVSGFNWVGSDDFE